MTLILDSHAVTALAGSRALITSWIKQGYWPPVVPAAVLAECLTGDHRRDFHANRFLRSCEIQNVTEVVGRHAAYLRTRARCGGISATDAIVTAMADHAGGGIVLTGDLDDLTRLATHSLHPIRVAQI